MYRVDLNAVVRHRPAEDGEEAELFNANRYGRKKQVQEPKLNAFAGTQGRDSRSGPV